MKTGIGAYEEIQRLAEHYYGNHVTVQADIFSDKYFILDGETEILTGTTEQVREALTKCNTLK